MDHRHQAGMLAMAVLLLSGCSLALGYRVATAEEAVPSPMKAATTFPELSQDITSLSMFAPELVAYLENPTTTCTLFAPNNQAMSTVMSALSQYVGLVIGNKTMQSMILNYHIIPGQKLKAKDLGTKITPIATKEGEPLYFAEHGGVPYVAFGREYVHPIKVANIQAGTCIIHILGDTLLAPPSLLPTFQDWVAKAGHPTALQGPKAVWLPEALPTVRATPATAKALDSSSSTSTERLQPESGSQSPSATSGVAATIRSESVLVVAAAGWLLVLSIL